jgi:hypothetical protein
VVIINGAAGNDGLSAPATSSPPRSSRGGRFRRRPPDAIVTVYSGHALTAADFVLQRISGRALLPGAPGISCSNI